MDELYEVVNKIIENDLNDEPAEQEEVAEEREAQDTREQEDTSEDTGYDNRGIDGTMSNSIGRGAIENFIKNSVYEKYNIDPQKMKDFSKLSPTLTQPSCCATAPRMWKNWLTLSFSDIPDTEFIFTNAARTNRDWEDRSPGKPKAPMPRL